MNPSLTSEMAAWQDKVFASNRIPSLAQAKEWSMIAEAHRKASGPNNLSIRHDLIMDAIYGGRYAPQDDFYALYYNQVWLEGPSYFEYTMKAYEWFERVTGNKHFTNEPDLVRRSYDMLRAPDGTLPLPEARGESQRVIGAPDYVSTPSHIVKRWPSGAYLLICMDPWPAPSRNLHHHLEAGYFALMVGGEWKARCKPYTGFNLQESATSSAFSHLLPPGALPPTWRLRPPRVTVERGNGWASFRWHKPWLDCTRLIEWDATSVRVTDRWMGVRKSVREWKV